MGPENLMKGGRSWGMRFLSRSSPLLGAACVLGARLLLPAPKPAVVRRVPRYLTPVFSAAFLFCSRVQYLYGAIQMMQDNVLFSSQLTGNLNPICKLDSPLPRKVAVTDSRESDADVGEAADLLP